MNKQRLLLPKPSKSTTRNGLTESFHDGPQHDDAGASPPDQRPDPETMEKE
jgi:hypothetical protein